MKPQPKPPTLSHQVLSWMMDHPLLTVVFVLITLLFWGVRLNNYENMVTFHIDQAEHIRETKEMVDTGKVRLIGPIIGSRIVDGIGFFIGPQYYYILAVFGTLLSWDILAMTLALMLMWWASALIISYWIGRRLDWTVGLLAYLLMAWHPLLIGFSRMIVNPNFLILFSIGFFYFLFASVRKPYWKNWLLAGIFAGLSISFHFVALTYLGIFGLVWLFQLARKQAVLLAPIIFGLGLLIGDLPYVLFELRHDFYNIRTMLRIGLNAGSGGSNLIAGYSIFAFWPLVMWLFAYTAFIVKRSYGVVAAAVFTLGLIFYLNLTSPHSQVRGIGMPKGWSVPLQQELAERICNDPDKGNFEIAAMITADLRAMDLRWFVEECGAEPAGYDQYPFVDTLFLVDQGFYAQGDKAGNWEIASMEPHRLVYQQQLNEFLWFYKLERIRPEETPSQ